MFDSRMPQIEKGCGSVVVVWICVALELVGALVCGHYGLTESSTFVRVMIRDGGDTNGPLFGRLLCPLI
jgi:hypothetical protein